MDEVMLSGYCRALDGSRVLCCERENGGWQTDCLYPGCLFAAECRLISAAKEKIPDFEVRQEE